MKKPESHYIVMVEYITTEGYKEYPFEDRNEAINFATEKSKDNTTKLVALRNVKVDYYTTFKRIGKY